MSERKSKQHHLVINENSDVLERIESLKTSLNLKSNEEVINHFIPKTDEDFFLHEWNKFKKSIYKCIPEDDPRTSFIQIIEAMYCMTVVSGKKIPDTFIDHFKKEFGGGLSD